MKGPTVRAKSVYMFDQELVDARRPGTAIRTGWVKFVAVTK